MVMKKYILQALIALYFAIYSLNAFAVSCDEISPNLRKEGDSYYSNFDVNPLTTNQKKDVKRIVSSVKSRLQGEGVFTECWGSSTNQRKVVTKERVSAKFNIESDAIIEIRLSVHDIKNKTNTNETLNYFSRKDGYSLVNITNDSITLSRRFREKSGRKGSTLIESIVKLSVSNGVLTINEMQYLNGHFSYLRNRVLGR